ncbi:MAG: iron-containing alcohol dehydrogenase [Eubacterium sp.]|nr:iron-containing alcohol dehydrogenase [Candidatus Colimonas fimequi]
MDNKLICRGYQLGSASLLRVKPIEKQDTLVGAGCVSMVGPAIEARGLSKVLIITTAGTVKRGMLDNLIEGLTQAGISHVIYDGVVPDPDIECVEGAVTAYREGQCDGIIAVGGGSAMDCAKVCGARVVRPRMKISRMAGLLKVRRKLPYFVAIPTTAGTGSEITAAAVITDRSQEPARKFTVMDFTLVPDMAVLDPDLTMNLPISITAETGMDAFTHAIEAYTNRYSSKKMNKYALEALQLINENLVDVVKWDEGTDQVVEVAGEEETHRALEMARENLLMGSYCAGIAFTNAYVGYVHAIAHAVGALYHIPHGRACAIILPYVLEAYGKAIDVPMARISETLRIKVWGSDSAKRDAVIDHIRKMNSQLGIPDKISQLTDADVDLIAARAAKEANPGYPVPVIFTRGQIAEIVRRMI